MSELTKVQFWRGKSSEISDSSPSIANGRILFSINYQDTTPTSAGLYLDVNNDSRVPVSDPEMPGVKADVAELLSQLEQKQDVFGTVTESSSSVSVSNTKPISINGVNLSESTIIGLANLTSSSDSSSAVNKQYVDTQTGDLTALTTDDKNNLVNAINEVHEKSQAPFRIKNWAASWAAGMSIEPCTTDKGNTSLNKIVFSIDDVEGADYQIVGMIAYEVFDNTSGGNRINCWPVCQFTGNGQKELSVRWVCAGTTVKTAKRINAWVLLKHR